MTPRERFQRDPEAILRHKKLLETPELQEAIEVAFSELCWTRLASPDDPRASWAANAQRHGAQMFITIFRTLADQSLRPEPIPTGQLIDPDATANTRYARPTPKRRTG